MAFVYPLVKRKSAFKNLKVTRINVFFHTRMFFHIYGSIRWAQLNSSLFAENKIKVIKFQTLIHVSWLRIVTRILNSFNAIVWFTMYFYSIASGTQQNVSLVWGPYLFTIDAKPLEKRRHFNSNSKIMKRTDLIKLEVPDFWWAQENGRKRKSMVELGCQALKKICMIARFSLSLYVFYFIGLITNFPSPYVILIIY